MSYTPTNWKKGDVVTSEKLNKMEQGIAAAGGFDVVIKLETSSNNDGSIIDDYEIIGSTFAEAYAKLKNGDPVFGYCIRRDSSIIEEQNYTISFAWPIVFEVDSLVEGIAFNDPTGKYITWTSEGIDFLVDI